MSETASLWTLFAGSFLAATVLPLSSEVVLFGVLKLHSALFWPALAVATTGNTLGGMSSYLIGRIIPARKPAQGDKALAWLNRHGSAALLLSWLPIVGDPLCVAAGWLRINAAHAALFMALGKLARYLVIAQGAAAA